jgi:glycosyltransferase involved in cell wall biosynthesis
LSEKPRVLFLFFEGLQQTVVDSQVLGHARELGESGIAEFEVWAVTCDERSYDLSLSRLAKAEEHACCPVRLLKGVRAGAPFSVFRNARMLQREIEGHAATFTHIHGRTDYSALVGATLARKLNALLIWDCRGDSAAEIDYRRDFGPWSFALKPFLKALLRRRMRRAAIVCDRALFVSRSLRDLALPDLGQKMHKVIPCCAAEGIFHFDPALRARVRSELGFESDDIVLVYSGGLQAYQRFDHTIESFRRLRRNDSRVRLMIVTPNKEVVLARIGAHERGDVRILSAQLEGINALLNAADAAFMLRDVNATNRVASPTKFAEYCLAGLPVIVTDAVPDSYALASEMGNIVPFDEATLGIGQIPAIDRAALSEVYQLRLGKRSQRSAYSEIYAR